MTTTTPALQRADEVLRRLAAAVRAAQLYSQNHPIIARNLEAWSVAIQVVHSVQPSIVIGLVGDEVIVDDMPLRNPEAWGPMIRRLQQNGVERVTISRGVTFEQLQSFDHVVVSLAQDACLPGSLDRQLGESGQLPDTLQSQPQTLERPLYLPQQEHSSGKDHGKTNQQRQEKRIGTMRMRFTSTE